MTYTIDDFFPGDRVELNPATNLWRQGARHGHVSSVGRRHVTVTLDGGCNVRLCPEDICDIQVLNRRHSGEGLPTCWA